MGIYNCQESLSQTLLSIKDQSYRNWELIMCDDGSTDATFDIAHKFTLQDSRMKVIKNEKNVGLAKSLNHCLEHSTGDYIMRHDGDDLMVVDRIEKQVKYMNTHECDACGSWAYLFDNNGVWGIRKLAEKPEKQTMVLGAPFIHPTVIMKRDRLLEVKGYSDNWITKQRLEDYDLWVKFFEKEFVLYNIQEALIYFREDKYSYNRKTRTFRITETRARLNACKRLKLPYFKRVLALKPLFVMMIPKRALRKYHIWKSNQQTPALNSNKANIS
ncbi:glycosyltransferase family 2 protein [Robertmurraya korlensis]|nr:glycosyltransferase family 2 protein [Robertmurraya korlensis]